MGGGAQESGNTCTVNEREDEHLDEDSGVVGMANIAEWAVGDDTHASGVHDLDVPMFAEGADDPPTDDIRGDKDGKTNGGEDGIEGTVKKDDFERGTKKNGGVQENHPAKTRLDNFLSAVREHLALVAPGNQEFVNTEEGDNEKKTKVSSDAQFHCSNKNSALKPGPKAAAMACSPAFRGRFSNHS